MAKEIKRLFELYIIFKNRNKGIWKDTYYVWVLRRRIHGALNKKSLFLSFFPLRHNCLRERVLITDTISPSFCEETSGTSICLVVKHLVGNLRHELSTLIILSPRRHWHIKNFLAYKSSTWTFYINYFDHHVGVGI